MATSVASSTPRIIHDVGGNLSSPKRTSITILVLGDGTCGFVKTLLCSINVETKSVVVDSITSLACVLVCFSFKILSSSTERRSRICENPCWVLFSSWEADHVVVVALLLQSPFLVLPKGL
jgi:hypothetical protein